MAMLSNVEIAQRLRSLAQLLGAQGANPFKVKAYRIAADTLTTLPESVDERVRAGADLTQYPGIGKAIAAAIGEIVQTGNLQQLETLRANSSAELVDLNDHPHLDPKRVLRAYKKLGISTLAELRRKLADAGVREKLGFRLAQYLTQGLSEKQAMLLFDADPVAQALGKYLVETCGARRAESTGTMRRRVEIVAEISFLIETDRLDEVVAKLQRYGGRTELVKADENRAEFKLPTGLRLKIESAPARKWGVGLLVTTGAEAHLQKLNEAPGALPALTDPKASYPTEAEVYRAMRLAYIEPELREGRDEVTLAARDALPDLVTLREIRGELHAHSTSSDGAHGIEEMAEAARAKSYQYLGITDHSQSLRIARGVSEEALWEQVKVIDRLNERMRGIRILKSAEVDILADGSLDYPDDLLAALDYTVCSIHSRFALGKAEQTSRVLRAMDNPHFTILGHATGRLLLRRPGYELEMERVIAHAKERGCFFEINASPDRLDLSAEHARMAHEAGVKIAISTDAHHINDLEFMRCGIDQARRAGLEKADILNCLTWPQLRKAIRKVA
ncbi:MAG: hypothetical protein JWM32_666 [Verrucomicrobia bacterium]|nr:hypothetical protein [Verrucomicrobiota bacterium]